MDGMFELMTGVVIVFVIVSVLSVRGVERDMQCVCVLLSDCIVLGV